MYQVGAAIPNDWTGAGNSVARPTARGRTRPILSRLPGFYSRDAVLLNSSAHYPGEALGLAPTPRNSPTPVVNRAISINTTPTYSSVLKEAGEREAKECSRKRHCRYWRTSAR